MYIYTYTCIYIMDMYVILFGFFCELIARETVPVYSKENCLYAPLCRKHSLDVK